jgi:hypothetical protein
MHVPRFSVFTALRLSYVVVTIGHGFWCQWCFSGEHWEVQLWGGDFHSKACSVLGVVRRYAVTSCLMDLNWQNSCQKVPWVITFWSSIAKLNKHLAFQPWRSCWLSQWLQEASQQEANRVLLWDFQENWDIGVLCSLTWGGKTVGLVWEIHLFISYLSFLPKAKKRKRKSQPGSGR